MAAIFGLPSFGRSYARAIDVSLGEICLASGLESLFLDKTTDCLTGRRHLFGSRVTLEGLIHGLIRQLLFCFLYLVIAMKNSNGSTFVRWVDVYT